MIGARRHILKLNDAAAFTTELRRLRICQGDAREHNQDNCENLRGHESLHGFGQILTSLN